MDELELSASGEVADIHETAHEGTVGIVSGIHRDEAVANIVNAIVAPWLAADAVAHKIPQIDRLTSSSHIVWFNLQTYHIGIILITCHTSHIYSLPIRQVVLGPMTYLGKRHVQFHYRYLAA